MIHTVQFVAILLASLSMSVHFGTWLVEAPMRETSSGALFIEVHKGRDRVASRVMPVLGNVAILAVGACVFLMRNEPEAFALSLAGLLLFLASMAVTLGGNVPINKQVQELGHDGAAVTLVATARSMGEAPLLTYSADCFRIRAIRLKRGVFQGLTAFRWELDRVLRKDVHRLLQADGSD